MAKICIHQEQELREEHKCPDCDSIVHVLCVVFDKEIDKYVCRCKTKPSYLTEIDVTEDKQMAMVSTITQSTRDDLYLEIPREYFITKVQKINHKYRIDGGEDYKKLKKE